MWYVSRYSLTFSAAIQAVYIRPPSHRYCDDHCHPHLIQPFKLVTIPTNAYQPLQNQPQATTVHETRRDPVCSMTTITSYPGRIGGSYSGSVRGNTQAVADSALAASAKQTFDKICSMPDSAWCSIQGLSHVNSTHGVVREYESHTLTIVEGSFHAHTDHDKFGRFKKWSGSASYDYDFAIKEHAV